MMKFHQQSKTFIENIHLFSKVKRLVTDPEVAGGTNQQFPVISERPNQF